MNIWYILLSLQRIDVEDVEDSTIVILVKTRWNLFFSFAINDK